MPALEIVGTLNSNNVRVVRMVCEEKGVPYEYCQEAPQGSPIADAGHPFGAVPVMRHGDLVLFEAKAIATYIDRAFGGPKLIPDDPRLEAEVEQWVSVVNSIVFPVTVRDFASRYDFAKDVKQARPAIHATFERMKAQFRVLNRVTASGHLAAGRYTLADINLMALLAYLRELPEVERLLRARSHLAAYFDRHAKRPAFKKTALPPFPAHLRRQEVEYPSDEPPGTIIIDPVNTFLYYVLPGGRAIRYGIGVGREEFAWSGVDTVSRKAEWPRWEPPARMIQRRPWLPQWVPGGPDSPLGARALYLGGSLYRIHGTDVPTSIGARASSGCFRMLNEDVIELYDRADIGTKVVVLPLDWSGSEGTAAEKSSDSPIAAL